MKKLISTITILVCISLVYSCREFEEAVSYPNTENLNILNNKQRADSSQVKSNDSLKAPVIGETDPPIKDGQDWKIRYIKKN